MSRRFVVFSDLHLHQWTYGASTINGRNSRLLDQAKLLDQVVSYLLENDIKDIVFTGDFFHTHSSIRTEVLSVAYKFLHRLADEHISPIFLIGNHDYADKEGDIYAIEFFAEYGYVVDKPKFYRDLFWAMSYTEDVTKLQKFLEKTPDNSIVLLHQGISRIPVNSRGFTINEILDPAMIPERAAGAFVGHYHSRFKVEGRNIWSPGSPMQLTWTDTGEDRGILDVTYHSDKPIEVKAVNLKSPRFVEIIEGKLSESVEDNFVRTGGDIEFKESVLKHGARSCELVGPPEKDKAVLSKSDSGDFDSLSDIVADYMDTLQLEPAVRKVGKDIMECGF